MSEPLKALFWKGDFDNYFLGHQAEEILKARIYAPYLENVKDAVVIDLGANLGLFSLYASKYAKQVYSLEPSSETFEIFKHMVEFNGLTNVKPINKAIYMENGTFGFGGPDNNRTMRSLHQATWQNGQPQEQVEAITMDKLFEDEGIEHVSLLKLDIEGSEGELLGSEGFRLVAPKIDVVVMENHSWNNRHPNQIKEALKNNGFIVTTLPNDAEILVGVRK